MAADKIIKSECKVDLHLDGEAWTDNLRVAAFLETRNVFFFFGPQDGSVATGEIASVTNVGGVKVIEVENVVTNIPGASLSYVYFNEQAGMEKRAIVFRNHEGQGVLSKGKLAELACDIAFDGSLGVLGKGLNAEDKQLVLNVANGRNVQQSIRKLNEQGRVLGDVIVAVALAVKAVESAKLETIGKSKQETLEVLRKQAKQADVCNVIHQTMERVRGAQLRSSGEVDLVALNYEREPWNKLITASSAEMALSPNLN